MITCTARDQRIYGSGTHGALLDLGAEFTPDSVAEAMTVIAEISADRQREHDADAILAEIRKLQAQWPDAARSGRIPALMATTQGLVQALAVILGFSFKGAVEHVKYRGAWPGSDQKGPGHP
jgi:hypothetical protein